MNELESSNENTGSTRDVTRLSDKKDKNVMIKSDTIKPEEVVRTPEGFLETAIQDNVVNSIYKPSESGGIDRDATNIKRAEPLSEVKNTLPDGQDTTSEEINDIIMRQQFTGRARTALLQRVVSEWLRHKLFDQSTGRPYIADYMDLMLKTALENPNSPIGQKMAGLILREDFLEQYDQMKELERGQRDDEIEYKQYKIRRTLYDKQQQVFDTIFPEYKRNRPLQIVCINSRRSGKTTMVGRLLIAELLKEGHNAKGKKIPREVAYINRTSSAAVRQIKEPLMDALESIEHTELPLRITRGSLESQEVTFNNGNKLLIVGNNNAADIDRLRGERLSLCVLDECGHMRNTRQLVREVLQPAMRDYEDSTLILTGTPPRIPGSYIADVYTRAQDLDSGWTRFHWTMFDNPYIPNKDTIIQEVCRENNVLESDPFIRREYFGELDVFDDDAKVIKSYAEGINIPDQLFDYAYVGVDWGFEDKAAVIGMLGTRKIQREKRKDPNSHAIKKPTIYVVWQWSQAKKSISDICKKVQECIKYMQDRFRINHSIQVICDNNEKSAVLELNQVYHIPNVKTAYKYDVPFALNQLNDFCSKDEIVVVTDPSQLETNPYDGDGYNGPLQEDFEKTLYKRDEETGKVLYGTLDDDVYHPNSLFALMYCSRQFAIEIFGIDGKNKRAKSITEQHIEEATSVTGYPYVEKPRNIEEANKYIRAGHADGESLIEENNKYAPLPYPVEDVDPLR